MSIKVSASTLIAVALLAAALALFAIGEFKSAKYAGGHGAVETVASFGLLLIFWAIQLGRWLA